MNQLIIHLKFLYGYIDLQLIKIFFAKGETQRELIDKGIIVWLGWWKEEFKSNDYE